MTGNRPDNCIKCARPLRDRRAPATPDTAVYAAHGKCRRCYYTPEHRHVEPEAEAVERTRRQLALYMAERHRRHIPWAGTMPTPDVFAEERENPGTHRYTLAA